MRIWRNNTLDCKLSVIFITYNHEEYVERALRSVLMQQTDFDFEVVVGEDCSTDSTREIVSAIADEYPEGKVRLLFREHNLGPTRNVYETTMACKGRYLAYLEGDDYWTDENKLQRQVDFLDKHPEYIGVTHDMVLVDENDEPITDADTLKVADLYHCPVGSFTLADYKSGDVWPGHYATLVSRNIYVDARYDYTILYRAHDFVDDAMILLFLLLSGDIYRMPDSMSVWRYVSKKGSGNWNSRARERDLVRENAYMFKKVAMWYEQEVDKLQEYSEKRAKHEFATALDVWLHHPSKTNTTYLKDMFDYGITHIVCKDQKVSLFAYSIRTIREKLSEKLFGAGK